MQNAVSGWMRAVAQLRSKGPDRSPTVPTRQATARRLHRRAIDVSRVLADSLTATPRSRERAASAHAHLRAVVAAKSRRATARRRLYRRHALLRLVADRSLPIGIALVVVLATGVSLAPAAAPVGAAQPNDAASVANRIAVGGLNPDMFGVDEEVLGEVAELPAVVDDGTLYKPVAVDTSVQTSAGMLRKYTIKAGDTLTGIASRFGVSMMTIWWANKLTSKDSLKVGQVLTIPPVNGLVVTVKEGDTLDSLAAANKVTVDDIVALNELTDSNLIVGQVLVLPGAKGAPLPTPKPTAKPRYYGSSSTSGKVTYVSGAWAWPVVGGHNYVSQYFHYGHPAIDIAADYGSPVIAARAGTVARASWTSGGCGYEVVLYHGNNLYTIYCHNSRILVSLGQYVSKGQQIAKIGSSGYATGPHVHFGVSFGFPYRSGSTFVNPLRYY